MRTSGRGTDGRTDIRGDANTPRPHFVGRGIKSNGLRMEPQGTTLGSEKTLSLY